MGLERAVAIPQQKTDGVTLNVPTIRRHNISLPIVVEVADRNPSWKRGGRVIDMGLEGAVAVTEEHGDLRTEELGYDQIFLSIAVDVSDFHGNRIARIVSGRVIDTGLEGAIAVAKKDAHFVRFKVHRVRIGDCQVGLAVAVKIADCD